jgi:hypothetical protein
LQSPRRIPALKSVRRRVSGEGCRKKEDETKKRFKRFKKIHEDPKRFKKIQKDFV